MSTSACPSAGPDLAPVSAQPAQSRTPDTVTRLGQDDKGTTAVEFGLIAVPFLLMLIGLMSVCMYFFVTLELENAVWNGGRGVRVGEYNKGIGEYAAVVGTPGTPQYAENLKKMLRKQICNQVRDPVTCDSKLVVMMQSRNVITSASSFSEPNCKNPLTGDLITQADSYAKTEDTGANAFVLLTACYKWDFGGQMPLFKIGNMPDGSFLMQATHAFVNENF